MLLDVVLIFELLGAVAGLKLHNSTQEGEAGGASQGATRREAKGTSYRQCSRTLQLLV